MLRPNILTRLPWVRGVLISALLAGWVRAAEPDWRVSVEVDRVVYLPGSEGVATVIVDTPPGSAQEVVVRSRLEYGMTGRIDLPDIALEDPGAPTLTIPFHAPAEPWGYALVVELMREGKSLAQGRDVFAIGTNPFRLGQQSSFGGMLPASAARLFEGDDAHWPTQWRGMKGTWNEIYCTQPTEVVGLATDWDQWITMQDRYIRSRKTLLALTEACHRLGIKVMMYNNATPSGWVGTRWARKHPEWLAYNYTGGMLGHAAKLHVEDLGPMKSWHRTMDPGPRPDERWRMFQPFLLAFGPHPGLVEFACDQMLAAAEDFGYDGVRFDGHWEVGQFWTTLGYDIRGRRLTHGGSIDATNMAITRHMKAYIARTNPDFSFGYNYGLNYDYAAARSPEAFAEACAGGGLILFEGGAFDETHSDWRTGARAMREAALRVHQNGGVLYGQVLMLHASDRFPANEFSLRYYLITSFAATAHIYAGVYPDHPHYLPLQGEYFRFALRHGDLLFDENLQPVREPTQHLGVTVNGAEHPDLWWKLYTYKRPLADGYQIITHLVNMPAPGVDKENSTPDKQPAPLQDVRLDFADPPARVFVLDPEADPWAQEHPGASSMVLPEVASWKIVVQEFPGSCEHIPIEVLPVETWDGKDILPDPENGRVSFPIASFARGEDGTRLVRDEEAMFGNALYCEARPLDEPLYIMDGPRQECAAVLAPGPARVTFRLKVDGLEPADKPLLELSGPFGDRTIRVGEMERPDAWQPFAFDYEVKEGASGYMTVRYPGAVNLWIDSILYEQVRVATDRERFKGEAFDPASFPAREAHTKEAHIARGLWHEYFGLDEALARADMEVGTSWEIISSHVDRIPAGFPETVEQMLGHDLIALLNISAADLQPANRRNLREYVARGGTLFVGGGTRAFGHGGYADTFLGELLPVDTEKHDLERVEGGGGRVTSPGEHALTKGIYSAFRPSENPFSNELVAVPIDVDAHVVWLHRVRAKPGATTLLEAGGHPVLAVWRYGQGTVYAMTGTPLGEVTGAHTPWWEWEGWETILDRIVAGACGTGSTP